MTEPVSTAAILMKLGLDLVSRPAQNGLARLTTWATGHEVLILGPARAGKTSFSDYLQYGILEKQQETATTIEPHKSASFRVRVGRSNLELKVRRAVDLPGEIGASASVQIAADRNPHAIVVILDASSPLTGVSKFATGPWLLAFCRHLKASLRNKKKLKKRLRCVIVVANKLDKLSTIAGEKRLTAFRKILSKNLADTFDPGKDCLPVLPCVLVDNPKKTEHADMVIIRLAKSLT